MWQKSQDKEEDFTLSDLDLDDSTFKSLIEKDISSDNKFNYNPYFKSSLAIYCLQKFLTYHVKN